MDTGASVSILGKGCRELVEKLGLNVTTIFSNVKTAGGGKHRILGKVVLNIVYENIIKEMELYLCPDLERELYLGIDFWRLYGLAPDIVKVNEINMEKFRRIWLMRMAYIN